MTQRMDNLRVVDPILTQNIRGYQNSEFIGNTLFPIVNVAQRGGKTLEFGKEAFQRYNLERAPGANINSIDLGYSSRRFSLSQNAIEGKVPIEEIEESQKGPNINLGREASETARAIIALKMECEQANLALNPSHYEKENVKTLTAKTQWNSDNSDPMTALFEGQETIRSKVGKRGTVLVLSSKGFQALAQHPSVIDRFKYDGSAKQTLTATQLAGFFNIDRVLVGESIYADDAGDFHDIWGNDAVLAYVPANASSRRVPSFGYTYQLQGYPLVERPYYSENDRSWHYPVIHEYQAQLVGPNAGFLFKNITGPKPTQTPAPKKTQTH